MIAKAKYFASNASFDAADRTVQILGSSGYSFETRARRHLVDTRVCRIYEGTDEIMVQKIAVSLLGTEYEAYLEVAQPKVTADFDRQQPVRSHHCYCKVGSP